MLINNKIFENSKLFDKKYFLFWEDYDLCRRLYNNKIPIIKTYCSRAHHLEHKSVKDNLRNAIATLKEREQEIISSRKLTDSPKTLEELSIQYGVSKERVRQIEARAMEKIRAYFDADSKCA